MSRALILLGLVAVAAAVPTPQRSPEEVNAFRLFLKDTQKTNSVRVAMSPVPEGVEFNPEMNGKYQGDILLDDFQIESMVSEFAAGRNAYTWPNTWWPDNTVVYEFGQGELNPEQEDAVMAGMEHIERETCVKFRRRTPQDSNYVRVTGRSDGCYANVGYWSSRGVHTLNLARNTPGLGCFRHTTIVHEWLHVLGFLHMQSTHNRDDYVRIVWENIQPGTEHNFDKYEENMVSNLGLPYDYESCMHYPHDGFSINGRPTIVATREHEGTMGQRERVTALDWQRLNIHYKCLA